MRVFTWVRVFLNVLEEAGVLDPSVVLHIRAVRVCEPLAPPLRPAMAAVPRTSAEKYCVMGACSLWVRACLGNACACSGRERSQRRAVWRKPAGGGGRAPPALSARRPEEARARLAGRRA